MYGLWVKILDIFGLHWVMPSEVMDLLFGWWNCLRKHCSDIWNLELYASCGLFGRRGTVTLLRIRNYLEMVWLRFFCVLSLIGLGDGGLLILFLSRISFTLL
jgi:hypothetical protein